MIRPDETLDDLIIQNLQLIQKKKGFRCTLDSILLGHFATVKKGDRIIDLGTGTGVIPLILSTRADNVKIIGVEIQEEIAEMANRSIKLNNLEKDIQIVEGDIKEIHKELGGSSFNLVTANPPYWSLKDGKSSPAASRALSRHEIACCFEDVVASASKLLNNQGRFSLVYCVERIIDAFEILRHYHLEPRRIRFVHPFYNKPARHILVEARKNAPSEFEVLSPLIIYKSQGEYTKEILTWYGKEVD
ncbi:MAG: tRNA1(Val) (adenine(37)-N6)-methyltransferase [Clostridia bacterium]|nr:tRNA1(Val) (adenine(37)-N6)-methyltransferase [Clostridia bacterium]MDD4047724.1 tRNA1(Val) (adenine(37)-N6)-methyltransferase [Clostridia bacterium]